MALKPMFKKDDKGKPRPSLLPADAVLEVAKVATHGAEKYGEYNWAGGADWTRYADAIGRHYLAWLMGNDRDNDSGLSHLAHLTCSALFLLAYQIRGVGRDNRNPVQPHGPNDIVPSRPAYYEEPDGGVTWEYSSPWNKGTND